MRRWLSGGSCVRAREGRADRPLGACPGRPQICVRPFSRSSLMMKKFGVVTVGVAAGLVAAAPFASAHESQHEGHGQRDAHSNDSASCNVTGGSAEANGGISGDSLLGNVLTQTPVGGSNVANIVCNDILNGNLSGNNANVDIGGSETPGVPVLTPDPEGATGGDPVDETPVDDTPADEAEADETEADETPVDGTEADETDAGEAPVDGTEADETDADEAPVDGTEADETDADEAPVDGTEADETDADEAPVDGTEADETDADEAPVDGTEAGETEAGETEAGETEAGETEAGETPAEAISSGIL
ncbi:hypothetical protein [Actinomycetospora sp. NBC_00405]|uniref:hypothetical protein n=1 Tax=Actinomycetospora sp. NBC_00405 TaxID=2975952 RepID=UPI002E200133